MVVGMATVFLILLIIIYIGKGLIEAVNKYAPEERPTAPKRPTSASAIPSQAPSVGGSETAAIVAAVSIVTHGKGKVTRIEKI